MTAKTDTQRIKSVQKILNQIKNFDDTNKKKILAKYTGTNPEKLFKVTGRDTFENNFADSCGHLAKAFCYANSLLPAHEQLDVKIMISTHPDHLIDSHSNHTLPCVKMGDGKYYAIEPNPKLADDPSLYDKIPMIKTPIVVGKKITHFFCRDKQYKIMALLKWSDNEKKLHDFNTFLKTASDYNDKTRETIKKIESVLKKINSEKTTSINKKIYDFCADIVDNHKDIAKKIKIAIIQIKDYDEHIVIPITAFTITLQKQPCRFVISHNYVSLTNIDKNNLVLWEKSLVEYINMCGKWQNATETKLLKSSTVDDLITERPKQIDENKKLSPKQIKQDISTLARVLIRAYVGWPVHNQTIKIAVLDILQNIYNTSKSMTVKQLNDKLGSLIFLIPDNHLQIIYGRPKMTKDARVGQNIAKDKNILLEKKNKIVKIGLPNLAPYNKSYNWTDKEKQQFKDIPHWAKKALKHSNAIVVDLRRCSGGNDHYTNLLAEYLCGGVYIMPAVKEFVRTTPEAIKIVSNEKLAALKKLPQSEEMQIKYSRTTNKINLRKAYKKPIYILMDKRCGSSGERFLLSMRFHPNAIFVGENSGGTEVYGNMNNSVYLPNSGFEIRCGSHYRLLDDDLSNYEIHGLKPTIKCIDGEDAFDVAMRDFDKCRKAQYCSTLFGRIIYFIKRFLRIDI